MIVASRPSRGHVVAVLALVVVTAAVLQLAGANPAVSQTTTLVAMRSDVDPGLEPGADVWDRAPATDVPLTAQQTTYPFGGGSIPVVHVRALHYRDQMFFRIEWGDDTKDDTTAAVEDFADAVAVQLPARPGSSVPSVCMGQADLGVNIWQWRADRERAGAWADEHPDGYVDLPASDDELDYPARAVGNPGAQLGRPAQDLVASGFGTLTPAEHQAVRAHGTYGERRGTWAVVLARDFTSPGEGQPAFVVGDESDVAFAVWNGSERERDGIKSVSSFATLQVSADVLPPGERGAWWVWVIGLALLALLVTLVAAFTRSKWFRPAR